MAPDFQWVLNAWTRCYNNRWSNMLQITNVKNLWSHWLHPWNKNRQLSCAIVRKLPATQNWPQIRRHVSKNLELTS